MAGALVLAACGTDDPARDADGRVMVSLEDVEVVGTTESIAGVADLQPADDGRVWVLNTVEPYFVVFGPDGEVDREFGRSGGGPAEFGAPLALVRGPDPGDVWTYDLLRHALVRLASEERRDVRLPPDSLSPQQLVSFAGAGVVPAPPWLEPDSRGFLMARRRPTNAPPYSAPGIWTADIVLVRPDSPLAALELHTPVADLLGDPSSRYPGATRLMPYPLWTVCADGTVVLYDPLENELLRLTESGPEASITLPEEQRLDVTVERLFTMLYRTLQDVPAAQRPDSAELRSRFEAEFGEFERQSAARFPEYADLRCTRDGTLWLQPFDVGRGRLGRGPDWYRISADGSRALVSLPEQFTPFRFDADRVWGTLQDAMGVASVAWLGADALR